MGVPKRFDDQILKLILHGVTPSIWVVLQEVSDVEGDIRIKESELSRNGGYDISKAIALFVIS